jgi:hypothetical protein
VRYLFFQSSALGHGLGALTLLFLASEKRPHDKPPPGFRQEFLFDSSAALVELLFGECKAQVLQSVIAGAVAKVHQRRARLQATAEEPNGIRIHAIDRVAHLRDLNQEMVFDRRWNESHPVRPTMRLVFISACTAS